MVMDLSEMNFSWVVSGRLAGCAGPVLQRDLSLLFSQGIRALVRLGSREEGAFDQQDIAEAGMEDCYEPVPDFTAPSLNQIERVIQFIARSLGQGKPVAISCGAGYGRTGTILSCYFVCLGLSAKEAIARVRAIGRCPYETEAQRKAIEDYEYLIRN
jgi:atypical dual specificity phosphatase